MFKRPGHSRRDGRALHIRYMRVTCVVARVTGVLAILRAKGDADVAIARGVELAAMGCRAMEVMLSTIKTTRLSHDCCMIVTRLLHDCCMIVPCWYPTVT